MSSIKKKIVVVGGGITGLAAAYKLQNQIQQMGLDAELFLVESSHRLGGKIQTAHKEGFVVEKGPDSFLARKKSMSRLIKEVGLEDQLVPNSTGQSFILMNDKLHPMPGGSIMGIPTQIKPFMTTELVSMSGKLRAAADFVLPRSKAGSDQSLGEFFRRRLGDEIVENLIEPLLSGIYAGDIDQISLLSTFPQFHQMEQDHRSLIAGIKKTSSPAPSGNQQEKKKKSLFLTLTSGLQSLVDRLEEKLDNTAILKGVKIESIEDPEDNSHSYSLHLSNGETLDADSVILTVPHYVAASIFQKKQLLTEFKDVPATSVATVAMAFPKEAVTQVLDGTGFVVSRNSDYTITACTWTHYKWPHTTPEGKVLLRCYVGRAGDEAVVDLADDQIEAIVLDDLNKIMNITAAPEWTMVTRWKDAMPQYTIGHKERLAKVRRDLESEFPGVYLAGGSYDGIGLPDCIDQGEKAAEQVLAFIAKETAHV
ncbi:protoporphyrinogen oxidase [Jeotgalibacillus proteolyticus]|uniref:Coproporphyrinogen III oxidase n=1 Tax=Jeotgalibacillus proteolyticus TaxID=2082395 RepID=A0A2S5GHL1_9BACL|nr:protoporphyrinogen oxidase [Jeotgalibacillus proteolyticus]PPA72395.1 protoporphyrinogen oxidase [Jeotgalibacillus proteolyticus]